MVLRYLKIFWSLIACFHCRYHNIFEPPINTVMAAISNWGSFSISWRYHRFHTKSHHHNIWDCYTNKPIFTGKTHLIVILLYQIIIWSFLRAAVWCQKGLESSMIDARLNLINDHVEIQNAYIEDKRTRVKILLPPANPWSTLWGRHRCQHNHHTCIVRLR